MTVSNKYLFTGMMRLHLHPHVLRMTIWLSKHVFGAKLTISVCYSTTFWSFLQLHWEQATAKWTRQWTDTCMSVIKTRQGHSCEKVETLQRFIVQVWKSASACLSHNSLIALFKKSLSKMLISHAALYQPRCPYLIFWTLTHYSSLSHNDFHIKKALDPTMIKRI